MATSVVEALPVQGTPPVLPRRTYLCPSGVVLIPFRVPGQARDSWAEAPLDGTVYDALEVHLRHRALDVSDHRVFLVYSGRVVPWATPVLQIQYEELQVLGSRGPTPASCIPAMHLCSKAEGQRLIEAYGHTKGAYLIRPRTTAQGEFVISAVHHAGGNDGRKYRHLRIQASFDPQDKKARYCLGSRRFKSLPRLVLFFQNNELVSTKGNLQLTVPITRGMREAAGVALLPSPQPWHRATSTSSTSSTSSSVNSGAVQSLSVSQSISVSNGSIRSLCQQENDATMSPRLPPLGSASSAASPLATLNSARKKRVPPKKPVLPPSCPRPLAQSMLSQASFLGPRSGKPTPQKLPLPTGSRGTAPQLPLPPPPAASGLERASSPVPPPLPPSPIVASLVEASAALPPPLPPPPICLDAAAATAESRPGSTIPPPPPPPPLLAAAPPPPSAPVFHQPSSSSKLPSTRSCPGSLLRDIREGTLLRHVEAAERTAKTLPSTPHPALGALLHFKMDERRLAIWRSEGDESTDSFDDDSTIWD